MKQQDNGLLERLQDSLPEERHIYYIVRDYQRMFNEVEKSRKIMRQASEAVGRVQWQHIQWQQEKERLLKSVRKSEVAANKLRRRNRKLQEKIKAVSAAQFGTIFGRLAAWLAVITTR